MLFQLVNHYSLRRYSIDVLDTFHMQVWNSFIKIMWMVLTSTPNWRCLIAWLASKGNKLKPLFQIDQAVCKDKKVNLCIWIYEASMMSVPYMDINITSSLWTMPLCYIHMCQDCIEIGTFLLFMTACLHMVLMLLSDLSLKFEIPSRLLYYFWLVTVWPVEFKLG